MALGIDQEIESRKDAYRGNPQQLQKRYSQNKQLVDLLALQQMKSDQEAVKRNQALKANQNAGTVAERLEAEVLDGYKQKQAAKIADTRGVLQNKQNTQNKNMQRMAAAAGKTRPTGLAALTGAQGQAGIGGMRKPPVRSAQGIPAQVPSTARMAQGGIIGFAGGRGVEGTGDYPELGGTELTTERLMALKEAYPRDYLRYAEIIKDNPDGIPFYKLPPLVQNKISELFNIRKEFSRADLRRLELGADPSGMDTEEGSGFELDPIEATERATDPEPETVEQPESETAESSTGDVTFEPVERKPSALEGIDTEVEAVVPQQVDTSQQDEAREAVVDQAAKTVGKLDPILLDDPDATQVASLEPVSPNEYLDATNQKLFEGLTTQQVKMINKHQDPLAMGLDARDESDDYLLRELKRDTRKRQIDRSSALEDEARGEDRINNAIRTLGGARRGAGGLGDAYLEGQKLTRERRSASEEIRRGIEDAAILTDTNIGLDGQRMQTEIGQQASDLLGQGIAGIQARLDTAAAMSRDKREGKQSAFNIDSRNQTLIDIRNSESEDNTQQQNAAIEQAGLDREAAARRSVLEALNRRDVQEQARLIQQSANAQQTLLENVKRKIEVAKGTDEHDRFVMELDSRNMLEMEALVSGATERLTTDRNALIQGNAIYQALVQEAGLAEGDDIDGAKAKLEQYESIMDAILADQFADQYARLGAMQNRLDQLRAQAGMPTILDPADPSIEVTPQ